MEKESEFSVKKYAKYLYPKDSFQDHVLRGQITPKDPEEQERLYRVFLAGWYACDLRHSLLHPPKPHFHTL